MPDQAQGIAQSENSKSIPGLTLEENKKAAELIQRTYRGHRARRELNGCSLDASTRWFEAVKDAQYQKHTNPNDSSRAGNSPATSRWKNVTEIARRAGADDESPSVSDSSLSEHEENLGTTTGDSDLQKRKALAKEKRKRTAKMMDLQYFLEMVDQKHRYGSSLRKYHAYWRTQDTNQNFFYWLDYGEGKDFELEECSRARLDREQVRYLSREERQNYLVKVDNQGKLIWAKNGQRVWTKDELYKDSINGIVPTSDSTPAFKYNIPPQHQDHEPSESSSDDESDGPGGDEGERYVNEDFHKAKGPAKLKHVSGAVFFNHMVRTSLKKGHKWIFVSDTSFRLYIGYKQSGAFQHSSFLHGARILSAGLIKVKDGQLRKLSPLSGHYRPPTANFRAFVHAMKDEGVDMSRVSISRSYAVLVGLEGYTKTTNKIKATEHTVTHQIDKVVRPQKAKEEEEASKDKSESAEKERQHLEEQRLKYSTEKPPQKLSSRFSRAFGKLTGRTAAIDNQGVSKERGVPGTGPEEGVPAPEGKR